MKTRTSLLQVLLALCGSVIGLLAPPAGAAIFTIDNVEVQTDLQTIKEGVLVPDKTSTANPKPKIFAPQVKVSVKVSADCQSRNIVAKAYFFDGTGKLITKLDRPAVVNHAVTDGVRSASHAFIWPTIVPADAAQSIYFPLPGNLPDTWSVVVVFGNRNGVVAASVPANQEQQLDYPERDLVAKTLLAPDVALTDLAAPSPLIEQVVESDNPRYPAFTLLLHLPHGVTDPREVSGVLATCLVADNVGQIRDKLNAIKPEKDPNPYFAFAEEHRLAILAWGARWVWTSYANFDELNQDQVHSWDNNFQKLADAWGHGVDLLAHTYGIPDHDYLMYGLCTGGEWVHRLALHHPDRFLAVQMHLSTSYDAPTPQANHVMWLLTTGELDGGCDRARRFYSAARDLGYPIIFKSIIGLGHADSPLADQLGVRFFDYALAVKARRDSANANDLNKSQPIDLSGFSASPFYGDLMNQEMFAAEDKDMIPAEFLVPLPSREIADAWNK